MNKKELYELHACLHCAKKNLDFVANTDTEIGINGVFMCAMDNIKDALDIAHELLEAASDK
jgi:hypothetical protein